MEPRAAGDLLPKGGRFRGDGDDTQRNLAPVPLRSITHAKVTVGQSHQTGSDSAPHIRSRSYLRPSRAVTAFPLSFLPTPSNHLVIMGFPVTLGKGPEVIEVAAEMLRSNPGGTLGAW